MATRKEYEQYAEIELLRQMLKSYTALVKNRSATICELKDELFKLKNEMKHMEYTS